MEFSETEVQEKIHYGVYKAVANIKNQLMRTPIIEKDIGLFEKKIVFYWKNKLDLVVLLTKL